MAKSDNEERKQRILNAAADLFVHYGYDKTTVSDIAGKAGVSKGAIYLHFKTKDDLFEALLVRESIVYQKKWIALLEADPKGGTIGGMYKNVLYALDSSDFMAAMFKQDSRVLGSYLRKPDGIFQKGGQGNTRYIFVKMMQEAGAMRQDIDAKVVAHIMNMLAYGLVAVHEVMDERNIPPTADVIEGIAEMMDRALTPEGEEAQNAGKVVLKKIEELTSQQLEKLEARD